MNVLEVKQLQIMREQRLLNSLKVIAFFYKVILVVGNQPYYTVY